MRFYINIEKKHLYFLIVFIILLSFGYAIASTWVPTTQGHDNLWINNFYGKNTNIINVYDDLSLPSDKTLQTSYMKIDKLTSTNINPESIVPIRIESNIEFLEGKNFKIGQVQGSNTAYDGNLVLTEIFPGQGIKVENGIGCPNCKKISATNFLSYELKESSCGRNLVSCYAYCSAGKNIIGGGCRKGSSGELIINKPSDDKKSWECVKSSATLSYLTAYAICADISGSRLISCTDTCSVSDSPKCSVNDVQICASDGDLDTCLEWKTIASCSSGQTCSNGQCITACTDGCSPQGSTTCFDSTKYQVCGNYDTDSCLEKGAITNCPSGGTCSGGRCSTAN